MPINMSSSNYHIFLFHTHIHSGGSRQKCLLFSLFEPIKVLKQIRCFT